MNTVRLRTAAAVISFVGWIVAPIGIANADCTTAGDFGAASGCAPSDSSSSGSGKAESWPPTSVDWPPQLDSDSASDKSGDKGGGSTRPTPIVMPDGQKPPPATPSSGSDSKSTPTTPTPIVPVGAAPLATAPSASATPAPIVTAHG